MILSLLRFLIVLCILLCSIPALAGHFGSNDLNPHQATAGLRLDLKEVIDPVTSNRKSYRLRAIGFPQNSLFGLYTKSLSEPFTEILSGLRVDERGKMTLGRPGGARLLENISLDPGVYSRGAAWNVAIASIDRSISAFTRIIPYPIVAKNGSCSISLERVSARDDRFLVTGSGFVPADTAMSELSYGSRIERKARRITPDGSLIAHVIVHSVIGPGGNSRYMVRTQHCETIVYYRFGEQALAPK